MLAVYPGTFDPITNGHRDIIKRAADKLCDRLVIGVADNLHKQPLFTYEERLLMLMDDVTQMGLEKRVEVRRFEGLLTKFAIEVKADIVVRGLRAVSDFEYEFQMTFANNKLDRNIETVFLMASETHHFTASSIVREIARFGGDIEQFVSPFVADCLRKKFPIR